jgi:hypothetical protein
MFRISSILTLCGVCCALAVDVQASELHQQLKDQSAAATQACDVNFPPGQRKTALARAKCQVTAIAILRPIERYPDLMDQFLATRILVGERIQSGKITIAEGNVAIAQKRSELISEYRIRLAQDKEASHATSQLPTQQPGPTDASPVICIRISPTMTACN